MTGDDPFADLNIQPAKVEPSSDTRQMAKYAFELYQAYIDAGFAEDKALHLVGVMMGTVVLGAMGKFDPNDDGLGGS